MQYSSIIIIFFFVMNKSYECYTKAHAHMCNIHICLKNIYMN